MSEIGDKMSWKEWNGRVWTLLEVSVLLAPLLGFLSIVPLFWLAPPASAEPEGDDRCTHWEGCLEQVVPVVPLTGPDQEGNEDGTAAEEKGSSRVGDDNPDPALPGF